MDCSLLQEDLCAYVDNELDDAARARVKAHVDQCRPCADEIGAFRATKAIVARLKLQDETPPESLRIVPEVAAAGRQRVSWLRRPVPGYAVALAAAAVLLGLLGSWQYYERGFIQRSQQRDAVWAHLRAVSSISLDQPGPFTSISTRPTGQLAEGRAVALREGAATIGPRAALHTVYLVGDHAISQYKFASGDFKTGGLAEHPIGNHVYRVGRVGDYSIASYEHRGAQMVLVSATSPKALLILAQNIPLDTPFDPPDVGY